MNIWCVTEKSLPGTGQYWAISSAGIIGYYLENKMYPYFKPYKIIN